LRVWRGCDGHGDDRDFLAIESLDECRWVIVIGVLHFDAGGELVRTVGPGDGGDLMFGGFDEFFYDELADLAACLLEG
jgi:hypothetical protein